MVEGGRDDGENDSTEPVSADAERAGGTPPRQGPEASSDALREGVPVAVTPFDAAPLEVLLPRVGAAVARHHRRLAARHGLTPTGIAVLAALEPDDLPSHRDLAARVGISPATLTPVLDSLEKSGDVRRERSWVDRRVVNVHRTAAGAARLTRAGQPEGRLPRLTPEYEPSVRRWLLTVLLAADPDY